MEKLNLYAEELTVSDTDDFKQQVVSKINEIIDWINNHENTKGHIVFTQSEPCVEFMDPDWYKIYLKETNDNFAKPCVEFMDQDWYKIYTEETNDTIVKDIINHKVGLGLPDDIVDDLAVDDETKEKLRGKKYGEED